MNVFAFLARSTFAGPPLTRTLLLALLHISAASLFCSPSLSELESEIEC